MPQLPFKDKGPVRLTWDYGDSNLVINPVLGTISFTTTDSVSDVQEEGYGETPVDAVFTGTVVELNVPMTRSTLAQLTALLEGVESGGENIAIFSVKSGCDMYSDAKQILIQPLCDNVPDTDEKTSYSKYSQIKILVTKEGYINSEYPHNELEIKHNKKSL